MVGGIGGGLAGGVCVCVRVHVGVRDLGRRERRGVDERGWTSVGGRFHVCVCVRERVCGSARARADSRECEVRRVS